MRGCHGVGRRALAFPRERQLGAFLGSGFDSDLGEGDFEAGGIVFRDELRRPQAVDESFAAAREVIRVQGAAGTALNAEMSALAASCFTRW